MRRRLDIAAGLILRPALAGLVRALDAAGIEPDDLVLRRPTLDEVFLTLTEGVPVR